MSNFIKQFYLGTVLIGNSHQEKFIDDIIETIKSGNNLSSMQKDYSLYTQSILSIVKELSDIPLSQWEDDFTAILGSSNNLSEYYQELFEIYLKPEIKYPYIEKTLDKYSYDMHNCFTHVSNLSALIELNDKRNDDYIYDIIDKSIIIGAVLSGLLSETIKGNNSNLFNKIWMIIRERVF